MTALQYIEQYPEPYRAAALKEIERVKFVIKHAPALERLYFEDLTRELEPDRWSYSAALAFKLSNVELRNYWYAFAHALGTGSELPPLPNFEQ